MLSRPFPFFVDGRKKKPAQEAGFSYGGADQRLAAASALRCMARVMDHCCAIDRVLLTHQ
ncbi:hypothetical protein D3C87_417860 [compost metagenome]